VKSKIQNPKSKIIVVGAGPAGASLAIRLAQNNFNVYLIERERFPRHKLCGEFISPECLRHFKDLDVFDEMTSAGGERITETVFYAPNGKFVAVPSKWFGGDAAAAAGALSLSRAEMDFQLLKRAKQIGVKVLEETSVVGILEENNKIFGLKIKSATGEMREICADLFVDATGRANILTKLAEKEFSRKEAKAQTKINLKSTEIQNPKSKIQNRLVGFKTHLEGVNLEKGICEIYFFRGGYGGLSFVENNRANHCFLMRAETVKEFGGDADKIVAELIFKNTRARQTMLDAAPVLDWLAVSVESFGVKNLNPAPNLFTIGDAAAFIDPFTGSGMLMALESAEILARAITENAPEAIAEDYKTAHRRKFQNRLRVCSILRRAVFVPNLAKFAVSALSLSAGARQILARSTRQNFSALENKPQSVTKT
jgi:flavin-dependent dehydrogenase